MRVLWAVSLWCLATRGGATTEEGGQVEGGSSLVVGGAPATDLTSASSSSSTATSSDTGSGTTTKDLRSLLGRLNSTVTGLHEKMERHKQNYKAQREAHDTVENLTKSTLTEIEKDRHLIAHLKSRSESTVGTAVALSDSSESICECPSPTGSMHSFLASLGLERYEASLAREGYNTFLALRDPETRFSDEKLLDFGIGLPIHRKLMLTEISKLRAVVFHVMVHEAHELPRGLALGIGRERHSIRATLGRHTRETRKLLGADPAWKYHLAFSAIDIGQLRSETVNFIVVGRNGAKKKCSLELPLDSIGFKKQPPHSYRLNDCNNGHGVLVLQPWLEWYE